MNTLLCLLFMLSLTAVVQAQNGGATIILDNSAFNTPVYFWTGYGPVGYPSAGGGAYIQILSRPSGSTDVFTVLKSTYYQSTDIPFENNGMFYGSVCYDIAGVKPYANAEFYARAWIGAVTWEKAVDQSSAFIGMSPVFEDKTGSWFSGTLPDPGVLYHFPSFTIMPVPEPGTMALFALGGFFLLAGKIKIS